MNYNECKKVLDYLDKNELEKLREYINKSEKNFYKQQVREGLKTYFAKKYNRALKFYEVVDSNLLICDSSSVFLLNDSSFKITSFSNLLSGDVLNEKVNYVLTLIDDMFNIPSLDIKKINKEVNDLGQGFIEVYSEDSIIRSFATQEYGYIDKFLGPDVVTKVLKNNKPVCIAESSKGKGLDLGLKK